MLGMGEDALEAVGSVPHGQLETIVELKKTNEQRAPDQLSAEEHAKECWAYADVFHACTSLQGRVRAYYRTGALPACGAHLRDFIACMRGDASEYGARILPSQVRVNTSTPSHVNPIDAGIWSFRPRSM